MSLRQTLCSGWPVTPRGADLSPTCGGREEDSGYPQRAECTRMAWIWCLAPPRKETRAPTLVWLRTRRVAGRRRSPSPWPVSRCTSIDPSFRKSTPKIKGIELDNAVETDVRCKSSMEWLVCPTNGCLFAAHPVWAMRPQDTSLEEGKPGYLHCQAKASPEPEVTWFRNNLVITPEVTHTRCIFPSIPSTCQTLSYCCFFVCVCVWKI